MAATAAILLGLVMRPDRSLTLPSVAALAVGAYYAFAAPDLAQALGLGVS